MLLGFGFALAWDTVDSSLNRRAQIAELGLTYLGEVPSGVTLGKPLGWGDTADRILVKVFQKLFRFAEPSDDTAHGRNEPH